MASNPFKFGKEVSGYQFYDRTEVAASLRRKLRDGSSNLVLFAPRRYGKTSLVVKVLRELAEKDGIRGLCFDLTRVVSLKRFCEEYVNSVYAMVGGRREMMHKLTEYLANCQPQLSVSVGNTVRVKLNPLGGLDETSIAEALDLPEKLAHDMGDIPLVIAFDEFQSVADLSTDFALERIFRSCIQAHRNVRYVFLGSKTHLMKRMFADASRPFYNSAFPIPLEKPPEAESLEFVVSRFQDVGIGLSDADVRRIVAEAENVPYYLQELAASVFEIVSVQRRAEVLRADIEAALTEIVEKNATLYAERLATLSEAQRLVLQALAEESVGVFGSDYRERHSLPVSSTLHTALKELTEEGIVDAVEGKYRLMDPFFARFLRTAPAVIVSR